MGQGRTERMRFLCHRLYNAAGTSKTTAKSRSFRGCCAAAERVCVSFLGPSFRNRISSRFAFLLSADAVFQFKNCSQMRTLGLISAAASFPASPGRGAGGSGARKLPQGRIHSAPCEMWLPKVFKGRERLVGMRE